MARPHVVRTALANLLAESVTVTLRFDPRMLARIKRLAALRHKTAGFTVHGRFRDKVGLTLGPWTHLGIDMSVLVPESLAWLDKVPTPHGGLPTPDEALFEDEEGYYNADATSTIGAEIQTPFGGVKNTGNGHREAAVTAIDFYSEWKTVYVDYSDRLQRAQIDV